MKKKLRILLGSLFIGALLTLTVIKLWEGGAFIFDRTATVSSNYVIWNGKEYSHTSGDYTEGRVLAKGNADWVITEVKEDPSHTFIVARSFLDQYLMVLDSYTIQTEGELTTVSWNGNYIKDSAFIEAIKEIEAKKATSFTYETDGIYKLTDGKLMRPLYFAYEGCPVASVFGGYMGQVDGKWVITTYISNDKRNEDGSPKPYSVSCYEIPNEYWDVLLKYFS